VRSAINLAMASPLVTAEAVEASSYPDLARRYQVFAVPKTVVNDRVAFEGAVPEAYLWSAIWQALGVQPGRPEGAGEDRREETQEE